MVDLLGRVCFLQYCGGHGWIFDQLDSFLLHHQDWIHSLVVPPSDYGSPKVRKFWSVGIEVFFQGLFCFIFSELIRVISCLVFISVFMPESLDLICFHTSVAMAAERRPSKLSFCDSIY